MISSIVNILSLMCLRDTQESVQKQSAVELIRAGEGTGLQMCMCEASAQSGNWATSLYAVKRTKEPSEETEEKQSWRRKRNQRERCMEVKGERISWRKRSIVSKPAERSRTMQLEKESIGLGHLQVICG